MLCWDILCHNVFYYRQLNNGYPIETWRMKAAHGKVITELCSAPINFWFLWSVTTRLRPSHH